MCLQSFGNQTLKTFKCWRLIDAIRSRLMKIFLQILCRTIQKSCPVLRATDQIVNPRQALWWLSRVDNLSVTLNIGHDCFYYTESVSFTHLVYLCTLDPFVKRKEKSMSLYKAFPIILCLQTVDNFFSLTSGFCTAS